MKKPWFLGLMAVLLLVFASLVSAADLDASVTTAPSGDPGTTVTGDLEITANVDNITDLSLSMEDNLLGADGTTTIDKSKVTFTPSTKSSLGNTDTWAVVLSVDIPDYLEAQDYTANIKVDYKKDSVANSMTVPLTVTVDPLTALSVETYDADNPLIISGRPDDTKEGTFTVKNTGNVDLEVGQLDFVYDPNDFKDNDGHSISLEFDDLVEALGPGLTTTLEVTVDIHEDVDYDVYSGIVTVSGSDLDTFVLEIRVQPEVCDEGIVGELDILGNLDTDRTRYAPGDTMKVDVDVKNRDDKDMDVIVEAFLYDIDDDENVAEDESDVLEIEDGKTETFELEIDVPTDVDADNTFILYVKAYEDDYEDDNCFEESKEITIRREKHNTVVDKFTITPATARKGEAVTITVEVDNLGTRNEDDVTVRVLNTELGLDLVSEEFDLDEYDEDDSDAVKRFSFVVPADAAAQEYSIEAIVTFNDGRDTKSGFETLTVMEEEVAKGTVAISTEGVITTVEEGTAFSIPVAVTNEYSAAKEFTVSLTNLDWASPVTDIVLTLQPEQTSTVYFYVNPMEGMVGKHSATVSVKEDGEVLSSDTLTFDVQEAEEVVVPTGSTVMDVFKGNTVWIVGDVVLLVIAIFLLRMLFRKQQQQ